MTPAIKLLEENRIDHSVHEYEHDACAESFGLEAAEKLRIDPERVFKTLVVKLDGGELAVGIVPVSQMLNMKRMAKASGAKKAVMANPPEVQRSTGYVLGGVSPLGQKKRLKTVIDSSAEEFDSIFVSAGRRGMDIELNPADLQRLLDARFEDIRQDTA
jgi:Cys-tRNA(Pro)/Cys-tRNA(Cys) deacylase